MLFCLCALAFSTRPTTLSGRANRVSLLNHPQRIHTHVAGSADTGAVVPHSPRFGAQSSPAGHWPASVWLHPTVTQAFLARLRLARSRLLLRRVEEWSFDPLQ